MMQSDNLNERQYAQPFLEAKPTHVLPTMFFANRGYMNMLPHYVLEYFPKLSNLTINGVKFFGRTG